MKPIFSIIVPIYKVEKYLRKCIDSVLQQSYDNFELILVDDGSPDDCPKICDEYAKKDSRINVVHKKNGGLVSARNAGLEVAKGEYVFNLDGDDWIKSDALSIIYKKAIEKNNPDVIVTNMTKVFDDREEEIPCLVPEGFYNKEKLRTEIYPYMMYDYRKKFYTGLIFPSAGGKIIKTKLLREHHCTDERIRMGEDNAYIFECAYYADSISFLDDHVYMYMQYDTSMVKSYDATRFDNNKILIEYITNHLSNLDERIDFQLNAFRAYWLIMAVFHEAKCKQPLFKSKNHVKESVQDLKLMHGIDITKLPMFAKCFMYLIKLRQYLLLMIMVKFINLLRK